MPNGGLEGPCLGDEENWEMRRVEIMFFLGVGGGGGGP